jgi:hypothetical protein
LKDDGNTLPFQEERESDGWVVRRFSAEINPEELRWHRDGEDREILIMESDGWALQKDNGLPQELLKGKSHSVRKGEWHRLLKGSGELVLRINKL